MNIKVLETKLQTIFEDDDLIITEDNAVDEIFEKIIKLFKNIAEYNNALCAIEVVDDEYSTRCRNKLQGLALHEHCLEITEILENDILPTRLIMLDFFEELLTNQDLYDLMKNYTPGLAELVIKLNKYDCFTIDEMIEHFEQEINIVSIEDLENISMQEYLSELFQAFTELLVPVEVEEKEFVKETENNEEE